MLTCERLQTVFTLSQRSDEAPADRAQSEIAPRRVSPCWRILTPDPTVQSKVFKRSWQLEGKNRNEFDTPVLGYGLGSYEAHPAGST